ncbi:hypothetical protein LTR99_003553 [Exophiala xenobiotica]|uniref:Uncharacterized protein n=1 Tax=Vermiconidia calcicola TaxID=1690605 RepID=A0AAV9PVZ2_9PEZI|nr:hypothetical protein LTR92_009892 [Exophiala xenobiotica]KAK5529077.1 hypothetical protein LTR25_009814 [Vermiconidia calcicola]KAK5529937.1 hypothetical protein LTR23_010489 [Chaetothyriales sp. CCFEE 6169]KAK5266295.1 hypothetical protein LTR96_008142 [Exophiala xenobiotica]KAK5306008.1 hypothetical protein LTR99_003553 [Exophiala xenobiotica]
MEENGTPPAPREDRGPRIPPAKLSSIEADPAISIFYRPNKKSPLQLLDGKFSRDAAMIFCDRIRRDLMNNNNSKSFTINGGDLTGVKEVLLWIKQCVSEQSIVKYRELEDDTPELFKSYANVIISATYLGIPARDLADGLVKRMVGISRKVLMSWEDVEWFYKSPALDACNESVRQVAAASVFYGWWNGKLNEEETPEDLMFLDVLRSEIPKLDQDLHDWCERNEQTVREKWAEKRRAKEEEQAGFDNAGDAGGFSSGGGGAGWDNPGETTTGGSGWDTGDGFSATAPLNATAGNVAPGGWDAAPQASENDEFGFDSGISVNTGASMEKQEHRLDANNPPPGEYGASHDKKGSFDMGNDGGDWAEEVNDHVQYQNQSW